ncbi:MAG TPA: phospholipid carrier-dependent glycosyltransferase [Candidatus Cybelea sp.]|nr:phospholipid carrier-dependent glycosyltransferase [Candidatus Cybelea sp.]
MDPSDRKQPDKPSTTDLEAPFPLKIDRKALITACAFGLVALAFFLFGIDKPPVRNFDEIVYVPAAQAVVDGILDMDPAEPPMGKLLVAAGINQAGDNPFGWRVSSAVCGALTLVAVFLWTHLLFGDYRASFFAALLTLLNNFLFVMSRTGMMDVFLVFFLFWSLVAYTAALTLDLSTPRRRILLCSSGFLLGLAGACKWNAVDTLAVLLGISFLLPGISKLLPVSPASSIARWAENLRRVKAPGLLFGLLVLPPVSYCLSFWVLFRCVHLSFDIHEFVRMNHAMWRYHVEASTAKTLMLAWYRWPFAASPMRFFSYLLGNPVVMWGGAAGIVFCFWRSWRLLGASEGFVVLLYASNLLQWAVTPTRVQLYYYYFPSAMFLSVALAVALRSLPRRLLGIRISLIVAVAAALVFLWCYPRMAHLDSPWDCALGCWE